MQEQSFTFNADILQLGDKVYLNGYWQSEKYFKEIESQLRQDFKFRDILSEQAQSLKNDISQTESVCLNVRRGDFVNDPILGTIGIEYYQQALSFLGGKLTKPVIYVFSDEIEWCQNNLNFPYTTQFITHAYAGKKFRDYLELMSTCKYFIIPNSTFAWWAAWLSTYPEKVVIAPKKWFKVSELNNHSIVPDRWITL